MSATGQAVRYRRDGAIGMITLDRPDNRNSMTPELLSAFGEAARRAKDDEEARCVVVTASGSCFSAGADLRSAIQLDAETPTQASFAMYEPFLSILDIEVPVIAALNGHAIGGGLGLALACDVRIANRDAKYGANFTRLGITPGMAISYALPRLVGVSRAAELLLSGRLIRGIEAASIGLVSEAVAADQVMARALALAHDIAANAPLAVRATKRLLYAGLGWDPRGAGWREAFVQARMLDTDDAREGMAALLEKRDPVFAGR
jgi:enoyl-CoA hydratase/carnithine racemase